MHTDMAISHPLAIIGGRGLIISRDTQVAGDLRALLERNYGCRAEVAPNAPVGWRLLERDPVDVVFVDLRQDEEADDDSHPARLTTRGGAPLPLIALSSPGERVSHRLFGDCRFHGWLTAPISNSELAAVLCEELPMALFATTREPPPLYELDFQGFKYRTYSREFHQTLTHLQTVAPHDVTILLVGETGTGKTTLARQVHNVSSRAAQAFHTVACGALPEELIGSELFGHVKGAFTSADRNKVGRFAAAGKGTLLLDEIDVLNGHQQALLLRVIETGEYEPVGSHETQRSEARLIVATNENLVALMEREKFRSDLYYRLNVLEFFIPPLRRRPLDIIPLTLAFVDEFRAAHAIDIRRVHPEFLACLKAYDWPGNVRELKNHVRRAVLFCRNGELTVHDLAPNVASAALRRLQAGEAAPPESLSALVATSEQEILEQALRAHGYHRTATAHALGISRVGLYKKMKKYGLLDLKKDAPREGDE